MDNHNLIVTEFTFFINLLHISFWKAANPRKLHFQFFLLHKCDCHTVTKLHTTQVWFTSRAIRLVLRRLFSFDFAQHLRRTQDADLTPDNARHEKHCSLDNDRHLCVPICTGFAPSQLDRSHRWPRICCSSTFLPSFASAVSAVTQCNLSTQSVGTLQSFSRVQQSKCQHLFVACR